MLYILTLFLGSYPLYTDRMKKHRELCKKCGEKRDGAHRIECLRCRREWSREDYKNNPHRQAVVARNRTRSKKYIRAKLLEYWKTHPCVDCGERDPMVLTFDHRNPAEKLFMIGSSYRLYGWSKIKTEIEKCDVRCANCHMRRTARQYGWFTYTMPL